MASAHSKRHRLAAQLALERPRAADHHADAGHAPHELRHRGDEVAQPLLRREARGESHDRHVGRDSQRRARGGTVLLAEEGRDVDAVADDGDLLGGEVVGAEELAGDRLGDGDVAGDVALERALDGAVAPARGGGRVGAREHVVVRGHDERARTAACRANSEPPDEAGLEAVRVDDVEAAVVDDARERTDGSRILHGVERADERDVVDREAAGTGGIGDLGGRGSGEFDLVPARDEPPREREDVLLHAARCRADHHQNAHAPSFRLSKYRRMHRNRRAAVTGRARLSTRRCR